LPAGRAFGVAVHESFQTVVAYVVEASVRDGRAVLHRATAGVHCNLAVNPRTVEAQLQGAAVMGLSMCLPGSAITLKDGAVEQGNFDTYEVVRLADTPKIEVYLALSGGKKWGGIGECGTATIAPAIANAIFAASGKRVRELPLKNVKLSQLASI